MNTHYRKKIHRHRGFKSRKKNIPKDICPVCSKPISKIITAITHKETGKKAHFECIISELKKFYALKPKEDICYLGGGSFGIIEESRGNKRKGFVIKRRIQYEER
jgi:hypothetical protein